MTAETTPRFLLRRAYQQVSPLMQNKKAASYFTITLSLFSLSFFGLFAIKPTLTTAISLTKSVNDLRILNMEYEKKIGSIIQAQAEYERIRKKIPLIEAAIPANASFSKLAIQLERIADRTGTRILQVQIDPVSISTPTKVNVLQSFQFQVIVTGTYDQLTSYLSTMLQWRRVVIIQTISLIPEGNADSGLLRLAVKGETFYEP